MQPELYVNGSGAVLVILLTMHGETALADSVFRQVTEILPDSNITMSVYESSEWDGDFSPWKFRINDERYFHGNGPVTLEKIKSLIGLKYERIFIAGYSLAGLFSLWAVHETDWFDGCACCSGSLWFDSWEEYSETHKLKKAGNVYLSLGGKEDKAKDPLIATIGDKTKMEDKRLERDPLVIKHTLVMNPGGHFSSPDKRLAQGIVWLLKESGC